MKKFFTRIFTTIGAMVVLGMVSMVVMYWLTAARVSEKTIIELDFDRGLTEYVPDDPLAGLLLTRSRTVRDVVESITQAAADARVVGLVARIDAGLLGLAQIQEVRDAILAFRSTGKPAIAHAETFGEFGPSNGLYYLATAFDEIYLQPSGDVGLTGLIAETSFMRGTLEKLGITPRFDHRQEYKNAMNVFTERQYTPPHREALERVMKSQFQQIVRGIAAGRKLDEAQVYGLVDRGPFLGAQALEVKLVDGLAYWDEVATKLKEKFGAEAERLPLFQYLARVGRLHTTGETIALIYGVGGVQRGKSTYDPFSGSVAMGADTVAAAFRAAVKDEKVKAILFRVDSPGGSYVASDTIWRETVRAKEAGKPVIVSMGNLAGSGGYFVAMAAHKIVAQPGTITGSIGVLAGKMLTNGLWDKVGVTWDEVHTSVNATMWSAVQDYTPAQWSLFQSWLDTIYDDFVTKVAQGRGLPKDTALQVAKGRIWTGEDAKALGLIDELGGFPVALRLAKEAAGIAADAEVRLQLFPRKKSFVETVRNSIVGEEDTGEDTATTTALRHALQMVQPVARLAQQLGLGSESGVLVMPEWETAD